MLRQKVATEPLSLLCILNYTYSVIWLVVLRQESQERRARLTDMQCQSNPPCHTKSGRMAKKIKHKTRSANSLGGEAVLTKQKAL